MMRVHTKLVYEWRDEELVLVEEQGFDYPDDAPVDLACGPSSSEENLQRAESGFMSQYANAFTQRYGQQTSLLNSINASLNPTVAKGPEQTGFSPEELASYNTQALNTTGANYSNAQRALNTTEASRGDSTVESGVQQQANEALASAAAGQTSNEELGITEANYAQGRQNYNNAVGEEESLAQIENPQSFGSLTQTAQGQSFNQADTIAQQQAQEEQAIAGGITSLAGVALTGGASALAGGGLSGAMKAMGGSL